MKYLAGLVAAIALAACGVEDPTAMDTDTVYRFDSPASVSATMDRLEDAVRAQGLTVFARIDHAANAQTAGVRLEPSQVLIFGNPQAGSQLIAVNPDIALDLPMRMLVRAHEGGSRIFYYDPAALAARHRIRTLDALLGRMRSMAQGLASEASSAP